jgi:hypothetical protein
MILRLAFVGRAILKADLVLLEDLLCGFPHQKSEHNSNFQMFIFCEHVTV